MADWLVTFTTREAYEVEADTEEEAFRIAEKELLKDRYSPIANPTYDEKEAECLTSK